MRLIPLRDRKQQIVGFALIDDCDYSLVSSYRWHLDDGYARHTEYSNGKSFHIRMHRLILGMDETDPRDVDHRNLNRRDNRRSNIRPVSRAQNMQNKRNYRGSRSPFRGVTWRNDRRKWRAIGTVNGKRHYLGLFDTEEEASKVLEAWRRTYMPYSEL